MKLFALIGIFVSLASAKTFAYPLYNCNNSPGTKTLTLLFSGDGNNTVTINQNLSTWAFIPTPTDPLSYTGSNACTQVPGGPTVPCIDDPHATLTVIPNLQNPEGNIQIVFDGSTFQCTLTGE